MPRPMMWELEWNSPSVVFAASSGLPVNLHIMSSGMVESRALYLIFLPSFSVTTWSSLSTATTSILGPYCCLSLGRSLPTPFQMAPVPPSLGNLKMAFGPQLPSSLLCRTLAMALLTFTVATLSPSQAHCISGVGTAHTL